MDFTLTAEHRELRTTLRDFFEQHASVETIAQLDREERFPEEIYAGMAALGLTGLCIPSEYGGNPADEISVCIVVEEVARASGSVEYAYVPTALFCAKGIAHYGTEAQKRAILPEVAAGRRRMAIGLSEPDAGSDLTRLSTRAHRDGTDFVLRGQKIFTTGADTADDILTLVRTDPNGPIHGGTSVLLVPRDASGLTVQPLRKLAGQATHTCEVFFDNVRVPQDALVGGLNKGLEVVFGLLDADRVYVGAMGCGIAQGVLDLATRYADDRVQFGQPIIEHQAVGHPLADIAVEVEMARLLVWRAAWAIEQGEPTTTLAAMAKIAGSEVGTRAAGRGMQVLGGYSYMVEYGMERYWREAKLNEIAGGTNQILRNMIVKHLRSTSR